MALKDILVIVDESPQVAARIDAALALAAAHDAHLTGLYISSPVALPSSVENFLTEEMMTALQAEEDARAGRVRTRFTEDVRRAGRLERSEWRVATGPVDEIAAIHGRYSDLVVVGQLPPTGGREPPAVEPETLVFACGRPVLVVPYVGHFTIIGQRVLVGWNGSREAARALGDAIPILERARMVTLLAINTDPGASEESDTISGIGIAHHLAHHGIIAEATRFICESREVGDTLLNFANDLSCDLVVMGAYGRSRLRSMVLGSLTGFILRHMTVPVLLSH